MTNEDANALMSELCASVELLCAAARTDGLTKTEAAVSLGMVLIQVLGDDVTDGEIVRLMTSLNALRPEAAATEAAIKKALN